MNIVNTIYELHETTKQFFFLFLKDFATRTRTIKKNKNESGISFYFPFKSFLLSLSFFFSLLKFKFVIRKRIFILMNTYEKKTNLYE
jgi:hypothetical protein